MRVWLLSNVRRSEQSQLIRFLLNVNWCSFMPRHKHMSLWAYMHMVQLQLSFCVNENVNLLNPNICKSNWNLFGASLWRVVKIYKRFKIRWISSLRRYSIVFHARFAKSYFLIPIRDFAQFRRNLRFTFLQW